MGWVEPLAWAYVIAIAVAVALRVFWFDAHWFLALLNDNALFWFAPLPVLIPFAIWQQERALLFALPGVCGVFLFFFGARFLPRASGKKPAAHNSFRVTSFNMHHENWDHDAFVRTIQSAQPDILGLQEVSELNRAFIETRLAEQFPYRVYQPIAETHAVALLSRYPFSNVEFLAPTIARGLRAIVQLPDTNIAVMVAHLAPPNMLTYPLQQFVPLARERFITRRAESEWLRAIGAAEHAPAILLGDCNMSDTSKTYHTIAVTWRDSFVECVRGLGHTLKIFLPFPLLRYDYVWHNDAVRAVDFHIGTDGGSDHLPVTATLQIP